MRCLIVDQMHDITVPELEKLGIEVNYDPKIDRQGILQIVSDYDGLIIRSKTYIDREFLDSAPKLKFIARAGAGVDNLDEKLIEERGIKILNAPEGNQNAVAEHSIGMLLSMMHNIVKGDREVRQGVWLREENRGEELENKTVGLLGYGHMGKTFAKKLKAFGCRVLAYDKYKTGFSDEYATEASMQEIYDKSEIFSIHVPLTEETENLVNHEYLSSFKKRIYLINTARGGILSLSAVIDLLRQKRIKKVALDVLDNEKLSDLTPEQKERFNLLIKFDEVVLTPHVAGWSNESYEKISQVLIDKIRQILTE